MRGKTARAVIWTSVFVLVIIVGGFLLLRGRGEAPTTTGPAQSPPASTVITIDKQVEPLVANTASLRDAKRVEVVGKLTVLQSPDWDGAMSEEGVVTDFVDHTTCTGSTATCPHITFYNLEPAGAPASYGTDTMKKWARDACKSNPDIEGAEIELAEKPAIYYQQRCSSDSDDTGDADVAYAWYIPSAQLFVTAAPGVAPEIIQGSLEQIQGIK